MSRHEFQVRFSPEQVGRTTWAYVRLSFARQFKWRDRLVALLVLVTWLWFLFEDRDYWVVWGVPLIFGCLALLLAILWTGFIHNQRKRLARMNSPVANMVADDDVLAISSDLGSASMPWSKFTGVLDGPEAIYLQSGKAQFLTLPIAGVDAAVLEFIRERVRGAIH